MDLAKRTEPFRPLAFYWQVAVKPHLMPTAAIVLLMLIGAVVDALAIGFTVPLTDVLTDRGAMGEGRVVALVRGSLQSLGIQPSANMVVFAFLVLVSGFFIIRSALALLNQYWIAAIAVKLRRTTKVALAEKVLHARYEAISSQARGTILHDINNPAQSLTGSVIYLGQFFTGMFNSLLMIGLLLYLSWWATLLLGIVAVAGVQGWRWFADRRSAIHGQTLYDLQGELQKLQVDAIDGLKVVKAHGLERRLVARQDELMSRELQPELHLTFFRHGPMLVNEVIAIAIVVGFGAITFFSPAAGLRVSMLVAFLLAIRRLAPAMASINAATVNLSRYTRDLARIQDILQVLPQERRGGRALEQIKDIRMQDVTFAYAARPDHRVLDRVTAAMPRGTVTAIVGSTGSGKSTIANLLIGLYEPQAGSILVNSVDLQALDLHAWRARVGYVSQDIFVFNATIKDNIALWDESLSQDQIEWAARTAQLHEFIASLPEGYETVVGDRGVRLSGGQCQRLAIARAILRRPEVLIFDEATSALDNLTERAVYDAINALHHEAIVIVIAHRLSTVREANQIIVLQGGRVIEVGTHDLLVGRRGVYAKLYEEKIPQPVSPGAAEIEVAG
ncbi:MAG: hypothetical protein COV75_02380 [Candidatus Omnitrophica bacterium CG11_big_fil_rev_8_21_14_0_20_63_9]|nr:MAG: hypothetical protein COV75_02380 [Candidatus Omnitrophica bacterium CG11_big_fil_rev_8_21_14_0_20_63_9]